MDITFITMHDLTADATLLYSSDSITEVLGYSPHEVVGRSAFEFFHPEEVSAAQTIHQRGIRSDKAAMLRYCKLQRRDGLFATCECVFTVVHSVIVACVSIYRHTHKSAGRASAAPVVRDHFNSSQGDPRYHMMSHLSTKFTMPRPAGRHEPRTAIILNRFSRTLSIMYATHALADILGIQPEEAVGRSFYEFVQEDCLQDAVDALERAKENDSIAYLRFRWRDPRWAGQQRPGDRRSRQSRSQNADFEGGPNNLPDGPVEFVEAHADADGADGLDGVQDTHGSDDEDNYDEYEDSNQSSTPQSSVSNSLNTDYYIEVEAVVSCTSDGLVVILRRARENTVPARGLFASPWALRPLVPPPAVPTAVSVSGPPASDFLESIRQVAVFAWSLRSINDTMMQYVPEDDPEPDSIEKVGKFQPKDGWSTHEVNRRPEQHVPPPGPGVPGQSRPGPYRQGPTRTSQSKPSGRSYPY